MTFRNAHEALLQRAAAQPDECALITVEGEISYAELASMVSGMARQLAGVRRCALYLDNGAGWVTADLALRRIGAVIVPIPLFFSADQVEYALRLSGVDAIITDAPGRLGALLPVEGQDLGADPHLRGVTVCRLPAPADVPVLPSGTHKVTFTSGTTGRPKGVCLSEPALDTIARSLCDATEGVAQDRHLSLLPYAALLENVAGIDVPLLAGATFCALPLAALGFTGSSGLEPQILAAALERYRPTSIVTVPQILAALMAMRMQGYWQPDYLRHVAVGGAVLAKGMVAKARALGLPVYEGYGLSECASVVTLNIRRADRPDSVGRPLPHCRVSIATDGEVLVNGLAAVGYLGGGEAPAADAEGTLATGDIGRLDEDGYLHLLGRKKNMFITAFGRNVAPDWVESELTATTAIAQAYVHGEARPWNAAVIVPRPALLAQSEVDPRRLIAAAIDQVNHRLPDYARVHNWILADRPFLTANNLLTWNGRLRRAEIASLYRDRLDRLYQKDDLHVYG
ncbi:MAG: AMP-binding protein [Proteobacteria bacterium]|nr:AMP-binding protein [Pseudomonadota bacterium]